MNIDEKEKLEERINELEIELYDQEKDSHFNYSILLIFAFMFVFSKYFDSKYIISGLSFTLSFICLIIFRKTKRYKL